MMGERKKVTFSHAVTFFFNKEEDDEEPFFVKKEKGFSSKERMSLNMGFPRNSIVTDFMTIDTNRHRHEVFFAASGSATAGVSTLNTKVADIFFDLHKGLLQLLPKREAYITTLNALRNVVTKLEGGDVAWLQENAKDFYRSMYSDGEAECATPLQVAAFVMDKLPK